MVAAVVLCRRGLRGRVLRLPACPACGYDMRHRTGLTCPECGHTVEHAQNLRRRERRPRLIAAGLACLLLLTPAGMQLRGVDAWSMAPAWVLLTACELGVEEAQAELWRRQKADGLADLSPAQRARFVDWAVSRAMQAASPPNEVGRSLMLLIRHASLGDERVVPLVHRLSADFPDWANSGVGITMSQLLVNTPTDRAICDAAARMCLDPLVHEMIREPLVYGLVESDCDRWDAVATWLEGQPADRYPGLREKLRRRREGTAPPP